MTSDFIAKTKAAIAEITDLQMSETVINLNNCDREPIHIPGLIQPHGVLLVLSEADWKILQVSANTNEYLGQKPETLLEQPLSILLTEKQIESIARCLEAEFEAVNPLRLEILVNGSVQVFSGVVHRSDEFVLLELEPVGDSEAVNFFDFYHSVKRPVSRLQQTQTLAELCQVAVEEVKQITGFDRVMVYQFLADGSGKVIAEAKQDELPSYLGLHYPASDVPKQAKYLYALNLLRLIPDVLYSFVPLISSKQPPNSEPLDLSLSTLRSVSPVHLEYLTNMGVRASMSISLLQEQKLWGLIACHHNSPRQLPYELRTICEFLGQVIALELATRENSEDADYQIKLKELQANFVETLTASKTLKEALTQAPKRLLTLAGATGVAVCDRGDIILLGETPNSSEITPLVRWLDNQFGKKAVYHTQCLSRDYPTAADFCTQASGLLALAISQVQQIYILWFRPELVQTVNWAGNPKKSVESDDQGNVRIHPRRSFELWKETVRQRSRPWKPCEIEAVLELRSAVIGLVLQKADELAALNSELERSNVELDAFAYIASHDLKEPLRGIHNYSSFLIEDYSEQLDEEGVAKLQTLMRLTQRMEDLINSLLHYSRLGRVELSLKTVDLNLLVDEVIDVVEMSRAEKVSFRRLQKLPELLCDRNQVSELFANLISNGIKYNDKAEKLIEIGYLPADEVKERLPNYSFGASLLKATVFYVSDNGIGIRPKHLDTVFKIFKRLHPPGRFGGGTGAGLTIARKIVERHGGQIWLDSVYGEGSTFYFTLQGQRNDGKAISQDIDS